MDYGRIWLPDSSPLVNMKKVVRVTQQWEVFKAMEEMVLRGELTFPRQVIDEIGDQPHPDMPGAWVQGVKNHRREPREPSFETVTQVMAQAGEVVDSTKTSEDADPYVIALAIDLMEEGLRPTVVTDDIVDRPPIKIAMATACGILGVETVTLPEFLDALDFPYGLS